MRTRHLNSASETEYVAQYYLDRYSGIPDTYRAYSSDIFRLNALAYIGTELDYQQDIKALAKTWNI